MIKKISNLGTVLSKENQKKISGGRGLAGDNVYYCYCGFTGGSGEDVPFNVLASNLSLALEGANHYCNGNGATCQY